jgi:hypothetical protein
MECAIRWRIQTDKGWVDQLIHSEGKIVEWNYWHDIYWGKCCCKNHNYTGFNKLGELLMLLRTEILQGQYDQTQRLQQLYDLFHNLESRKFEGE